MVTIKTSILTASLTLLCCLLPQAALAESFSLNYGEKQFVADDATLASWRQTVRTPKYSNLLRPPFSLEQEFWVKFLNRPAGQQDQTAFFRFRPGSIYQFIKTAALEIDVLPSEPELTIKNNHASSFTPPNDGLKVDIYRSLQNALQALEQNKTDLEMTVNVTKPQTSLGTTNDLGIKELVARGTSSFKGSPKNRRHNIKVGVEKFKGVIIAPGQEFSFNKNLGPVEAENGFLPELVIKRTGTVPELGGGLCQVSSTTFRAAMNAGLPITQRKNHAYAVQYYSPQGTDATIYPGVVDLKFINDTPAYILIWPHFEDKDVLIFDFYGTKDNRQVTLEKPVVYDRKTDGSMKALWPRIIKKDGQTSTSTFKSVYQSPALYHKVEAFPTVPSSTPATAPNISSQTN